MSNKTFLAGFVMLGLAAAVEAQPTSIGTLGGTNSYGKSINTYGQVAGYSDTSLDWANPQQVAFVWSPQSPNGTTGTMVGLGTLGGAQSWAHGINDYGQAVGKSNVPVGMGGDQAFVWTPTTPNGSTGTMLSIGVLGTGRSSEAYAINNAGQIAGGSYWTNDPVYENEHRAFLWTPDTPNGSTGTMVNLGTLGGSWSVATSISQDGKVAGWSALPGGSAHAFLWTPGGTAGPESNPQMQDLGALNGYNTLALGVNSAGQVVGQDMSAGAGRAFLWTPGGTAGSPDNPQMQNLGTLGGSYAFATGITETGAATGAASLWGDFTYNAFVWVPQAPNSTTGAMLNVGSFGGRITPYSINASGQIAGYAETGFTAPTHAFVMGPIALVNAAPTANAQSVSATKSTVINLTGSDPDNDALDFIIVTPPAHGTLSGIGASLTYRAARGYVGPDSFTFKVNDGHVDSDPATVSIEVGNRPPTARRDDASLPVGQSSITIDVLANDIDPNEDDLTIIAVAQGAPGIAAIVMVGGEARILYTAPEPRPKRGTKDTFSYTIGDGHGGTSSANVVVTYK